MTHDDCPNLAFLIWWNTAHMYETIVDAEDASGLRNYYAGELHTADERALYYYLEFWRLHTEAGGQ